MTVSRLLLRFIIEDNVIYVLGPTFLLTANIHGDEIVGVLVVHRFLEQLDLVRFPLSVSSFLDTIPL